MKYPDVYLLSGALGLLRGGMHMKKRVYVIKFLNRLCIIMLIVALMLLIIKIDICLDMNPISWTKKEMGFISPVGKCQSL